MGGKGAAAATPATVLLTDAGVGFVVHAFDAAVATPTRPADRRPSYGLDAAVALGVEPDRVFKTLVVVLEGRADGERHGVCIVPVTASLSLKSAAALLGAKRAEMCDPSVAERLTGYVVGGISPFGQRVAVQRGAPLPTIVDETCVLWDTMFVSGGRRGLDIEIAPDALIEVLKATAAPLAA